MEDFTATQALAVDWDEEELEALVRLLFESDLDLDLPPA